MQRRKPEERRQNPGQKRPRALHEGTAEQTLPAEDQEGGVEGDAGPDHPFHVRVPPGHRCGAGIGEKPAILGEAALTWIVSYGKIGSEAHQRLVGLAPGEERRYCEIGKTGAKALLEARYAHLRLGIEDDRIVVEAVTQGGTPRRLAIAAGEAEEQFEAKGINGHLRDKGPGARALREYAVALCRKRTGDVLVFEETEDKETRWRTASSGRNLTIIAPHRPGRIKGPAGGWERGRPAWGR